MERSGSRLLAAHVRLLETCGLAAGVIIALLALLIALDVTLRALGIVNFPWLIEVAEYALFVSTFLAAPWVLHLGGHVRVDVLVAALPPAAARLADLVANLCGLAVSGVLFWYGGAATLASFGRGSRIANELVLPEWWLLLVIPLSAALLVAGFARRIASGSDPGGPAAGGPAAGEPAAGGPAAPGPLTDGPAAGGP